MQTNSFLVKVKSNTKIQAALKWALSFVLGFYIFYIPSMSYTSKLNLIAYILLPLLGIISITYLLLYKRIDIEKIKMPITLSICFCIFAFISTIFGAKQLSALPRLFLVLLSGFVLFLCYHVFDKKENVILLVAFSMLSFVVFYFGYSLIFNRARLFEWIKLKSEDPLTLVFFKRIGLDGGGGPNIISSYFGTCAVLFLYLVLFYKKLSFKLFLIPYFLCIFAGVTTGSRQFIIAIALCSIVVYFMAMRKRPIVCIISAAVLILSFILFMTLDIFKNIRDPILNGLGLLENSRGDKSSSSRLLMLFEAFDIGGNRLFLGYGADGFESISGWGGYAHNTYANLYVSFGLFGLILYFVPMALVLFETIESKSKDIFLVVAFMVYYIIIGFFIVWYKDKIFFIAYSLILYLYSLRPKAPAKRVVQYLEINI